MSYQLIQGDALTEMAKKPDGTYTAVFCDPPYGISFMNRAWDHGVPSTEVWKEAYRICRPGAVLMAFSGTRTWHRLAVNIENAGWQMFDTIMYVYGSGFPKSHNVGNHAAGFAGYGSALKPAYEPILCFRKPLESTYAHAALTYGTAALNIDGCRVPTGMGETTTQGGNHARGGIMNATGEHRQSTYENTQGRWPANLIHDGSDEVMEVFDRGGNQRQRFTIGANKPGGDGIFSGHLYGSEKGIKVETPRRILDTGTPARFFYCAKASTVERNAGLGDMEKREKKTLGEYVNPSEGRTASKSGAPMANNHPTVKPLALTEYLARLILPPVADAHLLIPFAGVGSEAIGAMRAGWEHITGIELDADYCAINRRRFDHWQQAQTALIEVA